MRDMKKDAGLLLSGEESYLDYAAALAEASREERGDSLVPSDAPYWAFLKQARSAGKKIVYVSGPVPVEILYALDCAPLNLDLLTPRLAENAVLVPALMRETELHANADVCRMSKTQIGMLLAGNMGLVPDAYVAVPVPCDSACMTYMTLASRVGAPTFQFDVPKRASSRTLAYLEGQFDAFVEFLEKITGKKLDPDALRERMALSNRAAQLLSETSALRKKRPSPMSSHLNIWNELINAWGPTEALCAMLEKERVLCQQRVSEGFSPCPGGEKHRVLLLHNMLWQGVDFTDWLEKEYGAVTVADGYSFKQRAFFEHLDDAADCRSVMCRRMIDGAAVHGAGASGEKLVDDVCEMINARGADVAIFMGSSGCRHEWAATRMLEEAVQTRCGISMLELDTDNTDPNYRSEKEVKKALAEYMDTVVKKR